MNSGDQRYIWQADDWPHWRCDLALLAGPLTEVRHGQGALLGRLADVGPALRDQASLAALTEDVVGTSEIEGEVLSVDSVRSSIARRLGAERKRTQEAVPPATSRAVVKKSRRLGAVGHGRNGPDPRPPPPHGIVDADGPGVLVPATAQVVVLPRWQRVPGVARPGAGSTPTP
jgi:hypothetical protein